MRNHVTRWSAAALLLLTLAPIAHAQGTSLGWGQPNRRPQTGTVQVPQIKVGIVGGVSTVDTSGVPFTLTTGGALNIAEVSPAMDANLTFAPEQVINNTSFAVGAADSCAPLDTHRMRLGMLLIKCSQQAVGANRFTRLAISVRTHLNAQSDSSSTFPIFLYGRSDMGVTAIASQLDTTSSGHLVTGGAANPYSGEYVIVFDHTRDAPASAAAVSGVFTYPNGIAIPLSSIFGRDIYSPSTSIRVRNLSGPTVAVSISLVGTPL